MKLSRLVLLMILCVTISLPAFASNQDVRHVKKTKIQKQNEFIQHLQDDLVAMYLKGAPKNVNAPQVAAEAHRIAAGVIPEITRLKKVYHLFPIPVAHNMMISVGLKKRGACKHWAEDLLIYLRTVPREYFYVMWGEANPGKMHEHNVAVLVPNYGTFQDGIFIDPWRTAGIPFWLPVTADHHYKWHAWEDYGVY